MKILSGIPVLNCRSIQQTLDFYTRLLQFVVIKQSKDDHGVQWAHLVHADTSMMLQRIEATQENELTKPSGSPVSLYFFVDDIASLQRLLRANQVDVSDIVETEYRLREMSTRDPEGNNLRFGEAIKS